MAGQKDQARLKPTKPDDLLEIAKRLRKVASEVQGLASALEEKGGGPVGIEGWASLETAFKSFGRFVANCQKKVREF